MVVCMFLAVLHYEMTVLMGNSKVFNGSLHVFDGFTLWNDDFASLWIEISHLGGIPIWLDSGISWYGRFHCLLIGKNHFNRQFSGFT